MSKSPKALSKADDGGGGVTGRSRADRRYERKITELERKVGQLTKEVNLLKMNSNSWATS